jgi:hypothetical protein
MRLDGEADFHLIATGHDTTAVYVYSPEPKGRMKTRGIWAMPNDGFAWRRVEAPMNDRARHAGETARHGGLRRRGGLRNVEEETRHAK